MKCINCTIRLSYHDETTYSYCSVCFNHSPKLEIKSFYFCSLDCERKHREKEHYSSIDLV